MCDRWFEYFSFFGRLDISGYRGFFFVKGSSYLVKLNLGEEIFSFLREYENYLNYFCEEEISL